MKMRPLLLVVLMLFGWLMAGCAPQAPISATAVVITVLPVTISGGGGTLPPFPTPEPPTPIPPLPSGLSPAELKYRLLDQYPDFFFCDPDYYPIARADELDLARQRFPELQSNPGEFQAILNHNGLGGLNSFTDEQKLLIYRDHKKLAAIFFELAGDQYQFQLRTADQQQGFNIQGLIDGAGKITVQHKDPSFATCPICLAAHTLIDTPRGQAFVETLRVGDMVWTQNAAGERVAAAILKVTSVPSPANHVMVHIRLDDGRELWASAGHPTADGRRLGDLKAGDLLDGVRITLAERVPYDGAATYDLLPAGDTGFYWANGILLGSTLME